ncbi:MAG: adenine deaminase [Phycisphaerales bacterium]|nr:MAG: adenine deaminase [Phycisphaerales bacterium]
MSTVERIDGRDLHSPAGLARRIRVARGEEAGDLLLTGGQVVNVFTRRVEPGNIIICDGFTAGVGLHSWQAEETIPIDGQFIMPGLIDAHIHLESTLLTPAEFARLAVPHGTTAVIADPHEIANVLGVRGVELLLAASEGLPVDCYLMAPSCVPASPWESAGAALDAEAIASLLEYPRVIGLAEMMNFPGVSGADEQVLAKITAARQRGRVVDGHAPGLRGRDLVAYAAAGVRSDHECTTADEAIERADLGMLVQIREGSAARNLDTFIPLILEDRLGDWALCTDDVHPDDLLEHGHINALLRRLITAGVPPAVAVRHASLIPARHYGLNDRGAIAPGIRADLAVVPDLVESRPHLVIKNGQIVAEDGRCLVESPPLPAEVENTVHLGPLSESLFRLAVPDGECDVIGVVPDQIVTRHLRVKVGSAGGYWVFDPDEDLALIACIHRHEPTGRCGLGLVKGFGFTGHGALASTVAHDAHNLLIMGTNAKDMLVAAEALKHAGGGLAVVMNGKVTAQLELPLAGLISTLRAEQVCGRQRELARAAAALGCRLPSPFGTLSFLGLSVIPELRITDRGLLDTVTLRRV